MNRFLLYLYLMLIGGLAISVAGRAAAADAQHCTEIRPAIDRLACFDNAYNTPIYSASTPALPSLQTVAKLIWEQEEKRQKNDYSLHVETMLEHTDAEQERVIISAPALGHAGVRPLLAASCIDNITRLQLILPEPTELSRVNVQLRRQDGNIIIDEVWRTSEQGYAVDAGRGIPSINLLKQLLGNNRITVNSNETVINGVSFDIERLPRQIRHLQRACRWRGSPR